jgi:hypothetical protein
MLLNQMQEQVRQESVRRRRLTMKHSSNLEFQKSFCWINVDHQVSGGSVTDGIAHRDLFPQNLGLWRSIGPGLRHFDSLELWVTVAAGDSTAF